MTNDQESEQSRKACKISPDYCERRQVLLPTGMRRICGLCRGWHK